MYYILFKKRRKKNPQNVIKYNIKKWPLQVTCRMLMDFDDPVSLTLMISSTILKPSIMPSFLLHFLNHINIGNMDKGFGL